MAEIDEMAQYREGNKIALEYGRFILMAGSIFVSASLTIFGLSFSIQKPTSWALIMMFFASTLLYLMFLMYNRRYSRIANGIVFPMLQQFEKEKKFKLKFHTEIDEDDKKRKEACRFNYEIERIRFWNYLGFVVLLGLWGFRIIFYGIL